MAEQKTKQKRAEPEQAAAPAASAELGEHPYQGEPAEGWESTDLGEAAATGEFAYAGEPVDWEDDREAAERPGTPEHLGSDTPYAGSLTES